MFRYIKCEGAVQAFETFLDTVSLAEVKPLEEEGEEEEVKILENYSLTS